MFYKRPNKNKNKNTGNSPNPAASPLLNERNDTVSENIAQNTGMVDTVVSQSEVQKHNNTNNVQKEEHFELCMTNNWKQLQLDLCLKKDVENKEQLELSMTNKGNKGQLKVCMTNVSKEERKNSHDTISVENEVTNAEKFSASKQESENSSFIHVMEPDHGDDNLKAWPPYILRANDR